MSIAWKTALSRFMRALLAAMLSAAGMAGLQFLIGHELPFIDNPTLQAMITAALLALDKFIREKGKEAQP